MVTPHKAYGACPLVADHLVQSENSGSRAEVHPALDDEGKPRRALHYSLRLTPMSEVPSSRGHFTMERERDFIDDTRVAGVRK
jgi:hypothetical protein